MKVVTNLQKAYESEGKHLVQDFERNITLALIDEAWKTHLRKMDELKQSVQLAVHEQKDPLLIYKFEAFELFKAMINSLNKEVLSFLFKEASPVKAMIRFKRQEKGLLVQKTTGLQKTKCSIQMKWPYVTEMSEPMQVEVKEKWLKLLSENVQKLDGTKKL